MIVKANQETLPAKKSLAPPPESIKDCTFASDHITVTNTGEVLPCCFAQESIGNILRSGVEAVLGGPKLRILREDVSAGKMNPLCFNASCTYVRSSMKSDWTTFFPADRFSPQLGVPSGIGIFYCAASGDGFIFAGPHRYMPTAFMEAQFIFSSFSGAPRKMSGPMVPQLGRGYVVMEIVDETGQMYVRSEVPALVLPLAPPMKFSISGYNRRRFEFRAYAKDVHIDLLFKGVRLSGTRMP